MPKQAPMKWPLPTIVHPAKTVCYTIRVPKERHYIAAFLGAIFLLSKPYAWADDPDHTALEVGAVWRDIFDRLLAGNCDFPPPNPAQGGGVDVEMSIRQNPDNPCELQFSADGTDWCTWADISKCLPAPAQPGKGAPQPQPGGGCVIYPGSFQGSGSWLLPTRVSTGDVINITEYDGAVDDGSQTWYCANGQLFELGDCVGSTTTSSGAPLPSAPYMSLIAKIGASYYQIIPGPFTVPSGHSNDMVTFIANDGNRSDNDGSWTFQVQICNNQAGSWTSTLDFTQQPFDSVVTIDVGSYVPAQGYNGAVNGVVPNYVQIHIDIDSTEIDSMQMFYDSGFVDTGSALGFQTNGSAYGAGQLPTAGTDELLGIVGAAPSTTQILCFLDTGRPSGGPVNFRKWVITGRGPKPSQLP
jgi:hypothetical protein